MHELPFLLCLPDGTTRRTRFEHAVAYQRPADGRWVLASTHAGRDGARAVAETPLMRADSSTGITRIVVSGERA